MICAALPDFCDFNGVYRHEGLDNRGKIIVRGGTLALAASLFVPEVRSAACIQQLLLLSDLASRQASYCNSKHASWQIL